LLGENKDGFCMKEMATNPIFIAAKSYWTAGTKSSSLNKLTQTAGIHQETSILIENVFWQTPVEGEDIQF